MIDNVRTWPVAAQRRFAYRRYRTDRVGYPARPHHADRYGLTTTTFEQWAAHHDLSTLAV